MAEETKRPIRILHVVGGMNVGGVETWLMQVLRNIDRDRYRMDFLVHTDRPCVYDEEIRTLGSAIIPCLRPSNPALYAYNFLRILKQHGPYDVVHSHVHHFSGFVVWLALLAGVPSRLVHSHSDTSSLRAKENFFRQWYLRGTEFLIKKCATTGLACSRQAALDLYGGSWEEDGRWRLLYCGIDLKIFREPVDRSITRKEFGYSNETLVLGHVGRFSEVKNHDLLVEIFAEIVRIEPSARLMLVGDGPLRDEIVQKVERLGLREKVCFAGIRPDVPRIMRGVFDVFIFPSLFEGLPLSLVEAQAAGLPCIYSDTIDSSVNIVNELNVQHSPDEPAQVWAKTILYNIKKRKLSEYFSFKKVENSNFNLQKSLENLYGLYFFK